VQLSFVLALVIRFLFVLATLSLDVFVIDSESFIDLGTESRFVLGAIMLLVCF
jgi:hypothetical protein